MRLVILATGIGRANRGIGQYERHVLLCLLPLLAARGCQTTVILSRDTDVLPALNEVKYVRLPAYRSSGILRFFAEQLYVPLLTRRADAFLSLESVFPLAPVGAKRKFVVVHDIHVIQHVSSPERYPEDYTRRYKAWAGLATRRAVAAADRVITVSKFTADEIGRRLRVPPQRMLPILNGIDRRSFYPVEDPALLESVRMRYALPPSYYLFVGPYSKKKNLLLIVETYASRDPWPDIFLPVVVVGDTRRSHLYKTTIRRIRETGRANLFRFLGFVADEDLPALYSGARALLYPSLYEGFGLPPLEAMACGTPVVASNCTSIPEVVGNAALLIDPADPASLLSALCKLSREEVQKDLISKGLARARAFSWEHTARQIAETILDPGN